MAQTIPDEDFESAYDRMFDGDDEVDRDVDSAYDRDAITGRRSKRPKMSLLNKSKVSKQELDELFLE